MKTISWKRWVVWIGFVLAALFFPFPSSVAVPTDRTFHIQAKQFEYSPAILKVNPGDRVTIEFSAIDVVHGLSIDGYNLSVASDPGQTARVTFIADQSGLFRFRCTMTCGNMHPFMVGKLQVGPNILLWRAVALSGLALVFGAWRLWK